MERERSLGLAGNTMMDNGSMELWTASALSRTVLHSLRREWENGEKASACDGLIELDQKIYI